MATEGFINKVFPIQVTHLHRFGSDHSALKITLDAQPQVRQRKRKHLFLFEECWANDDRCEDMVRRVWSGSNLHCEARLGTIQALDKEFEDYRTSEIRKEINKIEGLLKDKEMWSEEEESTRKHRELKKKHTELLQTEEILWRQRSRAVWLKEGDKNSRFFHGKASQRRKQMRLRN